MSARWPQDLAIRNDGAYLDALSNENVPAARNTARELMRADPASIAHRVTLALAELRLHDALAALDAFSGLDFGKSALLQPRQGAVYAAVLWETSYNREAREVLKNLPMDRLLPEERELVRPVEAPHARDESPRNPVVAASRVSVDASWSHGNPSVVRVWTCQTGILGSNPPRRTSRRRTVLATPSP